jgi:hypothetical protein
MVLMSSPRGNLLSVNAVDGLPCEAARPGGRREPSETGAASTNRHSQPINLDSCKFQLRMRLVRDLPVSSILLTVARPSSWGD